MKEALFEDPGAIAAIRNALNAPVKGRPKLPRPTPEAQRPWRIRPVPSYGRRSSTAESNDAA